METIAVLLTVHNRKLKTIACIEALNRCVLPQGYDYEVLLTDDGSVDGTRDAIAEYFPEIRILTGNGDLFWNRGMHKAWSHAIKSNYGLYLLLNDDTLLKPHALTELISCWKRNPSSIIVGSTVDYCDESLVTYGGRVKRRNFPLVYPDPNKDALCDTFNGNIVLVPHEVVKKIGVLDPYFRHSFGDIEYGLRAKERGVTSYVVPSIIGYCSRDIHVPIFRQKGRSLWQRYKLLYSPLGYNPFEEFYLNRKYFSILSSCWWFIKIHINVLFTK